MKPSELLPCFPDWVKATPAQVCDSPAFTMPCRLGETPCTLRLDAPVPAETLDIGVRFENESCQIGLCDTAFFPELHKLWQSRDELPEPILLALIEKECGPLFQLLENALRRQLKVSGIVRDSDNTQPRLSASLRSDSGEELPVFTITRTSSVLQSLGAVRFLDIRHPVFRERQLPAVLEYAAFTLSSTEIASLVPGDALILPELDPGATTWPIRAIVANRFAVTAETGVAAWDPAADTRIRIVRTDPVSVPFSDLADLAADPAVWEKSVVWTALAKPLQTISFTLLQGGRAIADGHLERLGSQSAMIIDSFLSGGN